MMDLEQFRQLRSVAAAHLFSDSEKERAHAARLLTRIDARIRRLGGDLGDIEPDRPVDKPQRRYLLQ